MPAVLGMQAALIKPGREILGVDIEAFGPNQLLVPASAIINATLDRTIDCSGALMSCSVSKLLSTSRQMEPPRWCQIACDIPMWFCSPPPFPAREVCST